MSPRTSALLLALGSSAVYGLQVTPQCQSALTTIATSPEAACLNPSGLIPIVVGKDDASIVEPLDKWLGGLCSAAPCTNATISTIVSNITTGCTEDLGTTPSDATDITATVQQVYPTVRKAICLKDSTKQNQFCLTEELKLAQDVFGILSIANLSNVVSKISGMEKGLANVTCTNCVKEVFNIVNQDFPSFGAQLKVPLDQLCGNDFTDGKSPSDIKQTAVDAGTGSSSTGSSSTNSSGTTSGNSNQNANGAIAMWSGSAITVALSALMVTAASFT